MANGGLAMSDDLFGDRLSHVKRFQEKYAKPRRKSSWTPAVTVAARVAQQIGVPAPSPQVVAKIRQQRAEHYYLWAMEELARWKGRLPEAEWQKLHAHVESLKP
jgi:hypothetical protein